eukprot:4307672-Pleurochrysis_carterae.AAC.2
MCGSGGCELAPRGHSKVGASPPYCCHDTVTATTALPDLTQETISLLPHPAPVNIFDHTRPARMRLPMRALRRKILARCCALRPVRRGCPRRTTRAARLCASLRCFP